MSEFVKLGPEENAFARGGNRLCFVDPRNPDRCIKVPRKDKTPLLKRASKGLFAKLKPLSAFDDNHEEYQVFQRIEKHIGQQAFTLLPHCYGYVETEYGPGLCLELIRDDDGRVSISLKQYIWQNGYTDEMKAVIRRFEKRWAELGVPSRNLLHHNIVVQQRKNQVERLVVIDGLGWPDFIPLAYYFRPLARRKAKRKVKRLSTALYRLLEVKASTGEWGYHGWLEEKERWAGLPSQQRDHL